MAIPDFQTIMLPLLQYASDGNEHSVFETIEHLSNVFNLTEDEKQELLPSGTQARFANRVAWARSYFKQAGLVENTKRGYFKITSRGVNLLNAKPVTINKKTLEQYPEFVAFQNSKHESTESITTSNDALVETPEEQLEKAYSSINESLSVDLLKQLAICDPSRFEEIVVDVLLSLGYGGSRREAGRVVGRTGDGGIDGVINEDKLGLDAVYIQAKRWANPVGVKEIRDFKGALDGHAATKGVFITTSTFNSGAIEEAKRSRNYRIVLIDGFKLAKLMIENGVGVSATATYVVKKIDSDYFTQE